MSKTLMVIGGSDADVTLASERLRKEGGFTTDSGYCVVLEGYNDPDEWKDWFITSMREVDGVAICWPAPATLGEHSGLFWELRHLDTIGMAPESVKSVEEWLA